MLIGGNASDPKQHEHSHHRERRRNR